MDALNKSFRIAQFSARYSEEVFELSLAAGFKSSLSYNYLQNEGEDSTKNLPNLEPRGNRCINRLLMLYYKGGSLRGIRGPCGIETASEILFSEFKSFV